MNEGTYRVRLTVYEIDGLIALFEDREGLAEEYALENFVDYLIDVRDGKG